MLDIKKKLQEEITALEYELRNELPREILKARAHGDLSENAEYHAAKERQGTGQCPARPVTEAAGGFLYDRHEQDTP